MKQTRFVEVKDRATWHTWFAWRPVVADKRKVANGQFHTRVWGETVMRAKRHVRFDDSGSSITAWKYLTLQHHTELEAARVAREEQDRLQWETLREGGLAAPTPYDYPEDGLEHAARTPQTPPTALYVEDGL